MINVGIMQGRLSPPTDGKYQSFPKYSWKDEFFKAQQCSLYSIEWIFEADDHEKNPISTDEGQKEIIALVGETGVRVESICADYFMDIPYINADSYTKSNLQEKLIWLINQAFKLGVEYIDLPFVDNSSISGEENYNQVFEFLYPALQTAEELNVIIALETDLGPKEFKILLDRISHPFVKANYDTGNSSGMGYDCKEELHSYGEQISTIHIKDRSLSKESRPLGFGDANFESFFHELAKFDYSGAIILQAAREPDEVQTAIKNRIFVKKYLDKYSIC